MGRFFQVLLLLSTAGLSWLLMMVLHELGHMLHGWLSGAELVAVVLPPWNFSRTDFAANPHPQFVAWGGGLWGCLMPLAILAVSRIALPRYTYLTRWFAAFCLIANGAYLAGGGFHSGGADDASIILQNGGSRWLLLAFGIPAVAAGLYLWHGLGPQFGLGPANGRVDRRAAVRMAVALLIAIGVEIAAGLANLTLL